MKKYLVMVMALAISGVFVGCHEEEFGTPFIEQKKALFEETFIKAFGQPDSTHNWGFRLDDEVAVTRGVSANGNQWADPAYDDLLVPPPLTTQQIAVVREYFQSHRNLGYEDPQWTDYFIQQVYKGGSNVPKNCATPEEYVAADGHTKIVGSNHMDHLAAIDESRNFFDHNNNFNHGDCGTYGNVLKNGGNTNTGPFYSDKINLMTGSTTKSFGYYNSNGSVRHTEYTGLVSYKTIMQAMGAKAKCLDDGWNRSFMGFDFEQMVDDNIFGGDFYFEGKTYHRLVANTNMYCADRSEKTFSTEGGVAHFNDRPGDDVIRQLLSLGYLPNSDTLKDWVKVGGCADGYYSDWIVCLTEAKSAGNKPIAPKVWETGENVKPEPRYVVEGKKVVESGRVMCEDLAGATGKRDDMDYNDVVYDAVIVNEYKKLVTADGDDIYDYSFDGYDETYAIVRLMAAGGTIPVTMTIGSHNFDVHGELAAGDPEVGDNVMINTLSEEENDYLGGAVVKSKDPVTLQGDEGEKFLNIKKIKDIKLYVQYENVSTELNTTLKGATYMFLVPLGLPWAKERKSFDEGYPYFPDWVRVSTNTSWYYENRPDNLYDDLEGLEEPDDVYEKGPTFYDNNGGSSTAYKTLMTKSVDSRLIIPSSASETVLFDYTKRGPGYLCPGITTADGYQAEEYVNLDGSATIKENDIIRIYGVYLNDWYIKTNFSSDWITSDNGKGYIDVPVTSDYLGSIRRGLNIRGKHFTVTYVTVRSGSAGGGGDDGFLTIWESNVAGGTATDWNRAVYVDKNKFANATGSSIIRVNCTPTDSSWMIAPKDGTTAQICQIGNWEQTTINSGYLDFEIGNQHIDNVKSGGLYIHGNSMKVQSIQIK
jgi:hypothetical protein